MLHIITGPPCAGKSTYMREHAQDGDVLVDYDVLAQALGCGEPHQARREPTNCNLAAFIARRAVIEWATDHAYEIESWVIHTNPMPEDMDAYERAGAEIIALDTDMQTCLERAEADGRPPGTDEAIREWFEKHPTAPKGAFFMPQKGAEMNIKTKTVDVKADEANGTITGYAATFTHEKPDSCGDVIAKGAFAESIERIKAEGKAIPLLWNHDSGDLKSYIGTVTDLAEDDHGLLFTASFDATERAQRARELAGDGRLCKFSFAYQILDQASVTLEDGTKANELRKLDLHEVSLVMYPANPDTGVVEVKSDAQAGGTVGISGIGRIDKTDMDLIAKSLQAHFDACAKAGRRNSAKDADDLNRISELCGSIQSIVNGLLAEQREESDEQEGETDADEAKANAEEPDTANAEEPEAKAAEVDALLQQASELLEKKEA